MTQVETYKALDGNLWRFYVATEEVQKAQRLQRILSTEQHPSLFINAFWPQ